MSRYEGLFQILREEYGISNEKQLDEAIKKLGRLDITVFCAEPTAENHVMAGTNEPDLNR